jgi:hypothetical protein
VHAPRVGEALVRVARRAVAIALQPQRLTTEICRLKDTINRLSTNIQNYKYLT